MTTSVTPTDTKPKVLIVDDERFHVTMLNSLLRDDHTVMVATSGEQCLKAALTDPPDLILLDIEMPTMNGFEVLAQLKNDPFTEGIPVIFITARADADDEARGLEQGAADYISKPFKPAVVRSRVRTQLRLNHQGKLLQQYVDASQARVNDRDRMASLGAIVGGVSQELSTPLTASRTAASALQRHLETLRAACTTDASRPEIKALFDRAGDLALTMNGNVGRALELVKSFELVASGGASDAVRTIVAAAESMESAIAAMRPALSGRGVKVVARVDHEIKLRAPAQLMQQVVQNLVANAIRHAFPIGHTGTVQFILERTERERACLTYLDDGVGMKPEVLHRMWEPFFTTQRSAGCTGLGMSIVWRAIVDDLGGQITAESRPGEGLRLTMHFPCLAG